MPHTQPESQAAAASQVTHVDALPAGARLAEFEIQGLLGVGGFGMVYRAYDHSLHRTVAIKEYMPAALAGRQNGITVSVRSSSDEAGYQSGLQSFVTEARLLAQFDHPSLVKVYRFWEANNTAYMVMPLYIGVTLKQARSQMETPPPEEWLRTVLWSVLQGLHVLHRSDTLHRDVSPDNIFLQDVGPPVLLDLGASRRAIHDKSHKHTAVLKVNYAPIEQYAEIEDLKQGPWTDLYALAAVVYAMLRNDPPPPATTRAVRDSMPSVRSVAATVKKHFGLRYSGPFIRALTRALAVKPADRPQSLAAFVTDMKLKAPPRLSKFDWRAELGVELGSSQNGNSRHFDDTRAQAEDAATVEIQTGTVKVRTAMMAMASRRVLRTAGWSAAAIGLLVASVLVFDWVNRDSPLVAAPEPAALPPPVAVYDPPASIDEPVATIADGATPPPLSGTEPGAALPISPVVAPAPAPKKPVPQIPAHKPVQKKPQKPVPKKVTPPPAPAPKVPVKPPEPKVVAPPKPLCVDANFFSRPMCIHLECQKPENAKRPVCIEDRRRYTK
jgi:non-specific serine/threonine protein kinase